MKPFIFLLFFFLWPLTWISVVLGRPHLYRRAPGDEQGLAHPSQLPPIGAYVGVKAKVFEGTTKSNKRGPPHPGVVIGHNPSTGEIKVAMISNNHPGNPAQVDIQKFHPEANLKGGLSLDPKVVPHEQVKYPWHGAMSAMPMTKTAQVVQFTRNPSLVPHDLRFVPEREPSPPSSAKPHTHIPNPVSTLQHPLPPRPPSMNVAHGGWHGQHPLPHPLPHRPVPPHGPPKLMPPAGGRHPAPSVPHPHPYRNQGPYHPRPNHPAPAMIIPPIHPHPYGYHYSSGHPTHPSSHSHNKPKAVNMDHHGGKY